MPNHKLTQSQKVKLRHVTKDRYNHHTINYNNKQQEHSESKFILPDPRRSDNAVKDQNISIKQQIKALQKLQNPEEIIAFKTIENNDRNKVSHRRSKNDGNKEQQYQNIKRKFMKKIADLEERAEILIEEKLNSIRENDYAHQKSASLDLKEKRKNKMLALQNKGNKFVQGFENLIKEVKEIRDDQLFRGHAEDQEIQDLIDKKIHLLEKLMAERAVQSEIFRNHYFAISSISRKNNLCNKKLQTLFKSNKSSREIPSIQGSYKQNRVSDQDETHNKHQYKAPKPEEYEQYRYQKPAARINPQPFPRSSYDSQFLVYRPYPASITKQKEPYTFFCRNRKPSLSTYSKDYQTLKTDPIDYRQLDSYRNKIKKIQVSYIYKNDDDELRKQNLRYLTEQMEERALINHRSERKTNVDKFQKIKLDDELTNNRLLIASTQSRSQYKGTRGDIGSIRNKQLNNLKHTYRSLINREIK